MVVRAAPSSRRRGTAMGRDVTLEISERYIALIRMPFLLELCDSAESLTLVQVWYAGGLYLLI